MKLSFRRGSAFVSNKAKQYFENKNPSDIKKVTVVRHAAIGDWVVTRPFILELKAFFPNAKITLNVLRSAMYGMPDDLVDNIHIMDKVCPSDKTKKTGLFFRIKQARELPKQDIIFDLTDSTMTLLLMVFVKADIRIGYSYRAFRRWFYDISTLRSDFVLETQSMLHQLNILGANTKHYPLKYSLTKKSRDTDNPYIIYFAGASMDIRCWGSNNFIQLIENMRIRYPSYKHIILKGIQENEQFNDIYKPFRDFENVIHQNTFPIEKIYDYLAEASLIIVGDTGIRNMAIASNTPTLGLFFNLGISPMRYLPKTKEHKAVFNTEYQRPSVSDVFSDATIMIKDLYEEK